MSILVIDVGTSAVRASVVRDDATAEHEHRRELPPDTPAPGLVEFDPSAMATAALEVAEAALADAGSVDGVGIANQRASTVVWDRATGEPVGPGLGWQDLRTVGECLMLREQGLRAGPNVSATKAAHLLDQADPDRERDLCVGTVDTWIAWTLSGGSLHVTDFSNAALTGLMTTNGMRWDDEALELLRIPAESMPSLVDSSGQFGQASALDGAPPLTGILGDQQASLVGQGCVLPGLAKITFGTGGMLDLCLGDERPGFSHRGEAGTFPIITWRRDGRLTWGVEAAMLAAGSNVEWLRDDLGLIDNPVQSHEVASRVPDSAGVVFVPALLGFGTPQWDFGARGTLLGLTRGAERPHVVRAVLEGVAHSGADLVEAAEADAGLGIGNLRVDGGMSANPTFVQALADACQRSVEVSPVLEATTRGSAFMGGLAVGTWSSWDDVAATWQPKDVVDPAGSLDRDQWREACNRAGHWHEDLSSLEF